MEFTSFCSGFRYIRRRGRKYAVYREPTIHGSSAQKRYQHCLSQCTTLKLLC